MIVLRVLNRESQFYVRVIQEENNKSHLIYDIITRAI